MRRLLILPVVGALVFGLALTVLATQCETFTNHSGFVPDGWTATFTEDNIEYGPYQGPTFVDPETAHEGNRSWDTAVKCRTVTTTTTVPEETTTTWNTTTTLFTEESSTTTTPPTTTTPSTTSSSSLVPTSTTNPAPSSTAPTPSTTDPSSPELAVLPLTGIEDWLAFAALALIGAGWMLARGFRAED